MKTEETTSLARQADYESITVDDILKWCMVKKNGLKVGSQLIIVLEMLITGKYQLFDLRDDILRFKNSQQNA